MIFIQGRFNKNFNKDDEFKKRKKNLKNIYKRST